MKYQKLLDILSDSENYTKDSLKEWEAVVEKYPYFQAARVMYLKGLHLENSFLYNNELKVTAAHTTDREVLFDFVTSDKFSSFVTESLKEKNKVEVLTEVETLSEKQVEQKQSPIAFIKNEEESNFEDLENDNQEVIVCDNQFVRGENTEVLSNEISEDTEVKTEQTLEEKLEIGKPLNFNSSEKYSFDQWLNLASAKPLATKNKLVSKPQVEEKKEITLQEVKSKNKQVDIIDKFIETNPRIKPLKINTSSSVSIKSSEFQEQAFMTETLAKIYLEQKKYSKAIQACEILILKYPEKSSYFAKKIQEIKELQTNQK